MSYTYDYPRFALSVDAVLFAKNGDNFKVLLIQRKNEPFKGQWALPGGFVDIAETCDTAVHRELEEETGVSGIELKRIDIFDAIDRDPRDRVVSVAYTGVIDEVIPVTAQDDADNAEWFDIASLPELAFDHAAIIQKATGRLS